METSKKVTLLEGAYNIKIGNSNENETAIHFSAPIWGNKVCMHIVLGNWEIKEIQGNVVTLYQIEENYENLPIREN